MGLLKRITIKNIRIILCIGIISFVLTGCGSAKDDNKSINAENSSLKAENTKLKSRSNIVGSYKDIQGNAAIKFNSDGTGRYVYSDLTDVDTDDDFTWKKNTDNSYTIKLDDPNVTSSLIGKLSNKELVISGNSSWNTEKFNKIKGRLNLDQFLAKKDSKNNQNVPHSQINNASSSVTNDNNHPRLADGTDVYSLPLSDPRNPDSYKQSELMNIAGDPKYRNPDGSMNKEGEALTSSIENTFHQPE